MAKRVVPGSITRPYEKREGDFSPNLVGNQFTSSSAFFTFGNFSITSSSGGNVSGEFFNTGQFSDVITLDNLQITEEQSKKITEETNNLTVRVKTNPNKLNDYVYFSDAQKFIETEITDILNKWLGALFIRRSYITDTVTDFVYNPDKNISYFTISVNSIENPYALITDKVTDIETQENDISFIQNSFKKYEILNDFGSYPIISYTGNTETDDYIKIETKGLTWPTLLSTGSTSGSFQYYVKPNEETLDELFFSNLSLFQTQLMNRNSLPEKYTISLSKTNVTSIEQPFVNLESFTWPTSDGYNLAFRGLSYGEYVEKILRFAASFDSEITNIMVRKLVAEAIFEFDTAGDGVTQESGRKMDKLMKIWGREYDKVKTYIDSISFANVISYDGIENTPDELIKLMASNLGFDTIQSFSDNNLIKFFQKTSGGVFNPQQTNMSLSEMDREIWRRLVINAWWLFKSKGTRKVIEFFLKLFNIDECLVTLDEIVYLAENKLNYPSFIDYALNYYGFIPDDDDLFIDNEGYPKIVENRTDYYFQLNGFWYDGGVEPDTKPDLKGNNPHFGPYDFGRAYFEKFTCLVDNFVPVQNNTNLNLLQFNYFTDYTLGSVEGTGQVIVEGNNVGATTNVGVGNTLTQYPQQTNGSNPTFYAGVMNEDNRVENAVVLNAGRDNETSNNGISSFHINFFSGDQDQCLIENCPNNISLSSDGTITYVEQNGEVYTLFDSNEIDGFGCCEYFGYENYLNINDGTSPCYWCPPNGNYTIVAGPQNDSQLLILKPDGETKGLTQDCCTARGGSWTTPVNEITVFPSGNTIFEPGTPYCKFTTGGIDTGNDNTIDTGGAG